jgi:iron complex transport system substrate-binding protein
MDPSGRSPARLSRRALLLGLALAPACGRDRPPPAGATTSDPAPPGAGFPVTVRDDLGRSVTVAAEPRRIVALLPSHTETLFALGAGDRVVGVDDNSDYPPEAARLPRLGALYDPRVEQTLALRPDLVLASEYGPAPTRLAALGLTVWAGSAARLADVYRVLEILGRLVGRSPEAAALAATMRRDVDALAARVRALPRVRVYDELDPTPYTVGPGSFVGALLDMAGGDNIVPADLGEFPRISPELVIARDPEVILGVPLAEAAGRPGWAGITAVKRGAVHTLTPAEQGLLSRPGPRLAEGLALLGRRLHPDRGPADGGP